ncbi:uncharacterized protein LOC113464979 isoform X2 [Ceratina calcarata]|uniref:Uncharacterized protein LOC113464979 isoform X2 n=1 Tax=Ceratina calcarata TaxID=156304 RepID=A0AAJ7WEQ9_9HYME|nr:uncharacterized protein LOC113464979 isoform X2 [Ceratina calcarata]
MCRRRAVERMQKKEGRRRLIRSFLQGDGSLNASDADDRFPSRDGTKPNVTNKSMICGREDHDDRPAAKTKFSTLSRFLSSNNVLLNTGAVATSHSLDPYYL